MVKPSSSIVQKPVEPQRLGMALPERVRPSIDCPVCGAPLKRWHGALYCEVALSDLTSGWKE